NQFRVGNVFARRDDLFSAHRRGAARRYRNESAFADPPSAGTSTRAETFAQFAGVAAARKSGKPSARSSRFGKANARMPGENRKAPGDRSQTGPCPGDGSGKKTEAGA